MQVLWGNHPDRPEGALQLSSNALNSLEDIVLINPSGQYDGAAIKPKGRWAELHSAHKIDDIDHSFWANEKITKRVGIMTGLNPQKGLDLIKMAWDENLSPDDHKARILVLNGPNLNMLGQREPEIYGHDTLADLDHKMQAIAPNTQLVSKQSNHEGEMLDTIQSARNDGTDAIIINAGAYTHTSVALHDALLSFAGLVIELHISNPHQREVFRHRSFITRTANMLIAGFGPMGYPLAMAAALRKL